MRCTGKSLHRPLPYSFSALLKERSVRNNSNAPFFLDLADLLKIGNSGDAADISAGSIDIALF